jgi:hypothetical protein
MSTRPAARYEDALLAIGGKAHVVRVQGEHLPDADRPSPRLCM